MKEAAMTATSLIERLFSLQDRVALITGASGDIGRVLATGLAGAGAKVALHGRSVSKLEAVQQGITDLGGEAASFTADLASVESIPPLVQEVIARFGHIDILVNCAGINQRLSITDVTPAIYDQILATNLRGTYFLSQAILPHMIAQGGGKIVHIGSLSTTVGLADVSVYGLTKSAIGQLTKTMAVEWAQHNIQVNCLCPGFIQTELTIPLWTSERRREWMLDRLPSKRGGKPEDLVGLLLYLASQASNYMTGQTLYVDGGFLAGSLW